MRGSLGADLTEVGDVEVGGELEAVADDAFEVGDGAAEGARAYVRPVAWLHTVTRLLAEHLAQLGRRDRFELRVRTGIGITVVAPAPEASVVTEPAVHEPFVCDLDDTLDAQRFP